ncbi:hypothetical protein GCM10025795_52180 [Verticiella sediminum]
MSRLHPESLPDVRWRTALTASLPVGLGYLPTGFAFGVLAVQAGLPLWLAMLLSVFVYAGALQFAAIPMLASGAGLAALATTAFLVNLRHLLYALPLLRSLPRARAARAYALAALTDETYSLVTAMPAERRAAMLLPVAAANQAWWVAGTLGGAWLGPTVAAYVPNLQFALPCLFLILAIEQYRAYRRWQPAVVALVCLLGARWALPPAHVLAGALLSALAWLGVQAWHDARRARSDA